MLTLLGCSADDKGEAAREVFERHVESCVCRFLDYESESYSGVDYPDMVAECNAIVQQANKGRHRDQSNSNPSLESLRCTDDIDDWRETIEEVKAQQEANREGLQDFLDADSGSN